MLTSVILPTKDHAVQARQVVESIFATTPGLDVECIVVAYPDNSNQTVLSDLAADSRVKVLWSEAKVMDAWNMGAAVAQGEYLHASSDDFGYTDGWLKKTIDWVKDSILADNFYARMACNKKCWWAEFALGHRNFFKNNLGGVLMVPHYQAIYVDVEVTARAMLGTVYTSVPNVPISHNWNATPRSPEMVNYDKSLFILRAQHGFPNNYSPVIK